MQMSQARGLRGTMTWAYGVPAHVTRGSPGPGGADRVVGAPSMARYLTGMATPFSALLAAALAATPLLARQQPAADPPGALPYEAAFDRRELLLNPSLAVTRDGNRIAYEVRQPLAGANLNARFLPNGTPSAVAGSKVMITDRAAARTFDACPGGSCWRPVWSPDGNALAFYSDLGGPPALWVYDLAARKARKLSAEPVKAKLWAGDEPVWSPDGHTIYVPLAPEGEYRSPD